MKITVITGTEIKGVTYRIKNIFLDNLRTGNEITEFYLPKDMPEFCCGCKNCFLISELKCPHSKKTMPIWNAIIEADLIVFATPVYALRVPGQVKALLDHFCCHWTVHRPDEAMLDKKAVIISNSIGAPNGSAQKDIKTSLNWLGVSHVKMRGIGLMEGVVWEEISEKRRLKFEKKINQLARKYISSFRVRKSLKVRLIWFISRNLHKNLAKKEKTLSADNQYWRDKGWI